MSQMVVDFSIDNERENISIILVFAFTLFAV